jgi:hypothetical protein
MQRRFVFLFISGLTACVSQGRQPHVAIPSCPDLDHAYAFRIEDTKPLVGPEALGGRGDFMLRNAHVGVVIQAPEHAKTYYPYGGTLIDAVAFKNCKQSAPEMFGELGFVFAKVDIQHFDRSLFRYFRGVSAEILNDGKNGSAAILRVHGVDDRFWLLELDLLRDAIKKNHPKQLSEPFGLDVDIDYILQPNAHVVTVVLQFHKTKASSLPLGAGIALFLAPQTKSQYFSDVGLSFGGRTLDANVPWFVNYADQGAYAFTLHHTNMATTQIGGVNIFLNIGDILHLSSADKTPTSKMTMFLSVGDQDPNSAVKYLQSYNPEPLFQIKHEIVAFFGHVFDAQRKTAVARAKIDVQMQNAFGNWRTLDSFLTTANGQFSGQMADFHKPYRLLVTAPGRQPYGPVNVTLKDKQTVLMAPHGQIKHRIRDAAGRDMPAKISLYQNNKLVHTFYPQRGHGDLEVPPGRYEVSVTRGYEYQPFERTLTIPDNGEAELNAVLKRVVNTTGYLAVDAHAHGDLSPDSAVSTAARLATEVAEGVEVVVSTEHEAVADWSLAITPQLKPWIKTVIGQEVTATLPEHTSAFPLKPDPHAPRGGPVAWQGLDLDGIFLAERARGAQIVTLNHPRNYLRLIKWDPILGATLDDPTLLGLPKDAALWSWNLDAIEIMNGPNSPFDGLLFDAWVSGFNIGHSITGLGTGDAHDLDGAGKARTYVASPTDDPQRFKDIDLVRALQQGRAVASTGAFARVKIDKATLGDLTVATDGAVTMHVHVEALPQVDVSRLQIFVNCDAAASMPTTAPHQVIKFDDFIPLHLTQDAYIIVVGFGDKPMPRGLFTVDPQVPRFITNPIYVDVDHNGVFDAPGPKKCAYNF